MEAKRRALDEIAARQRAAEERRKEDSQRGGSPPGISGTNSVNSEVAAGTTVCACSSKSRLPLACHLSKVERKAVRLSGDSLNVSARCGCSPKACQIRLIVIRLSPLSLANPRVLQCVWPRGVFSRVRITTFCEFPASLRDVARG